MLALLVRLYDFFEPCSCLVMNKDKPKTANPHRTSVSTRLSSCQEVSCGKSEKKIHMRLSKCKSLLPLRHRHSALMSSKSRGESNKHVAVHALPLSKSLTSFSSPTLASGNVAFKPSIVLARKSLIEQNGIRKSGEGRRGSQKFYCDTSFTEQDSTTGVHNCSVNQPEISVEMSLPVCCTKVQKSFTLSKQHTATSASEAGIPIIPSQQRVHKETSRSTCGTKLEKSKMLGVEHAPKFRPFKTLIEPDPATPELPLHSNSNTIVVYTPKRLCRDEIVFEQYLLTHVYNQIAGKEQNIKQSIWRQRLLERFCIHKTARICTSDSTTKIANNVTDSHDCLQTSSPSQQLASKTSKTCDTVTAVPLLHDPKTKLPLTPICTATASMKPLVLERKQNPWSLTTFIPDTPHKEVSYTIMYTGMMLNKNNR